MSAAIEPEANETALRAALYLRVSTGRQAEADLSIPDQRRQALAFCAARGWDVAIEFVEPGASGMDERRPELQRMLDMALTEAPPFNVVVVHSFSRRWGKGALHQILTRDPYGSMAAAQSSVVRESVWRCQVALSRSKLIRPTIAPDAVSSSYDADVSATR
jgi:hypothetical protein